MTLILMHSVLLYEVAGTDMIQFENGLQAAVHCTSNGPNSSPSEEAGKWTETSFNIKQIL